jgi:hypothetical protein
MKRFAVRSGALLIALGFVMSMASASAQGILTLSNTIPIPGVATDDIITDTHLNRMYTSTATSILTWSLSNPTDPTLIATTPAYGFWVQKMYSDGNYLYAVSSNDLSIYKIQNNTTQPLVLWSHIQTLGTQPDDVAVSNGYAYVTDWTSTTALPKVEIFNVSKKASPTLVATIGENSDSLQGPAAISINGDYAYITSDYNSTLNIFDITNPTSPTQVASLALDGAVDMAFNGSYVYVSGVNSNVINVVNIANPAQPVAAGVITPPQQNNPYADDPASVVIKNNEMYVNTINGYNQLLISYDLSKNPIQPTLGQTFNTTGEGDLVGLAILGKTLYQAINGPSGPSQSAVNVYSIAH